MLHAAISPMWLSSCDRRGCRILRPMHHPSCNCIGLMDDLSSSSGALFHSSNALSQRRKGGGGGGERGVYFFFFFFISFPFTFPVFLFLPKIFFLKFFSP